jgi:hypothetical protein
LSIEVIVDRAVKRGKFLQTSHSPEPEHGSFPSSKGLMRILAPIVQPTADLSFIYYP